MPGKRHVAFPLKRFAPLILLIPLIILVLFLILRIFVSQNSILLLSSPVFPRGVRFVNNQIIVKYRIGQSPNELRSAGKTSEAKALSTKLEKIGVLSQQKLFTTNNILLTNYYLFILKQNLNIPHVYEQLNGISQIENVTPNYILTTQATPNDPYFKDGQQWDMKKINMEKAWGIQKGKPSVLIAVIDTGADYTQEDLQGVIVKGENEVIKGGDIMDDSVSGHGTHVSGTIAAVTNNGIGISSMGWGSKVMAIKACDAAGDCPTSGVLSGIEYAVNHGARIINISIAGDGVCSDGNLIGNVFNKPNAYDDAIKYATDRNVLIIAAAGNHNQNAKTEVPGACKNVLAIGATNQDNFRWISAGNSQMGSNFGSKVKIAAPGEGILSTSNKGGYILKNGTSMAAPHVSGAAALLLSFKKSLTREQLINCLVNSAIKLSTDQPIGSLLNPAGALIACGAKSTVKTPAILTPTPTVFIQEPFSISGIVFLDKNGDGLLQDTDLKYPGAQVILSGLSSNSEVSNSSGRYAFANLLPGTYTITLTVNGKSINEPIDVTLSPQSSIVRLDLPIPMGTVPLPVVSPTPTLGPTSSAKCVPDPACVKSGKSIQVCSFKCK